MVKTSLDVRAAVAARAMIRLARSEDAARIAALQRLSLRALARRFYDRRQLAAMLRCVTILDDHLLRDRTYYVVELDTDLAGCGGWSERAPNYQVCSALPGDCAQHAKVRAMYVHPRFAGCGLGRRLLETIESSMLGAGHHRAHLEATLCGVPLYLRCGYVPIQNTELVFPNGVRAPIVRMQKSLSSGARA